MSASALMESIVTRARGKVNTRIHWLLNYISLINYRWCALDSDQIHTEGTATRCREGEGGRDGGGGEGEREVGRAKD